MPTVVSNRFEEPIAVQPAVGRDNDEPISGDATLETSQEAQPVRSPRSHFSRTNDHPRDGDSAAVAQEADGQNCELVAETRGVHGQRQSLVTFRP